MSRFLLFPVSLGVLVLLLLFAAQSGHETMAQGACVNAPSDLVSWWPLDEASGAPSLQDIIGGNNATPVAPQPVSGVVDGAIHFLGNGLSGAYVAPQGALFDIGLADFSIDAWVNFDAALANSRHYIVNKFDSSTNKGYALYVMSPGITGNERLEFMWGDGSNVSTVQSITPITTNQGTTNEWHHVAVTFARSVGSYALDIRLYVDGAQQGIQVGNPPGLGSLVNFLFLEIGSQPSTIDEPITIDELEIFNRALNPSEIADIYNAGSAGKCKPGPCPTDPQLVIDLVSCWPAEENAVDVVGGYNGTLSGNATFGPGHLGRAFSFNPPSGRVSLSSGPSSSEFTVDAWVYILNSDGYRTIYADNARGFWLKAGKLNWWAVGDRFLGVTVPTHKWQHVALTYSNSTFTGYLNGFLDSTSIYAGQYLPTGDGLGIGGHSVTPGEDFIGLIDQVRIFKRALTEDEIHRLSQNQTSPVGGVVELVSAQADSPRSQAASSGPSVPYAAIAGGAAAAVLAVAAGGWYVRRRP